VVGEHYQQMVDQVGCFMNQVISILIALVSGRRIGGGVQWERGIHNFRSFFGDLAPDFRGSSEKEARGVRVRRHRRSAITDHGHQLSQDGIGLGHHKALSKLRWGGHNPKWKYLAAKVVAKPFMLDR
jgi:hypothetical protein